MPVPVSAIANRFAWIAALLLAMPVHAASDRVDPLEAVLAAEFALQSGDADAAARHYMQAARTSGDPLVAERAARLALHAGDREAAGEALQRWRSLDPDDAGLVQTEALLALAAGEVDAAVEALARLVARPGAEGWQRALQALAGQPADGQAGVVLEALLQQDLLPAEPDAWFAYGGLAGRMGLDELAGRLAERAVVRFPESARVWLWQAQRHRLAGDEAAARQAVARAVELDGDATPVRLTAAAELDALGDSSAAAALLAQGPQDADTLLGQVAYLARGEDQDAMAALYRQLQQQPALPDGDSRSFLLGQLAELLERHEEALAWYRQVVEPGQSGQARLRQAVVLDALGRHDQAQELLRELQASDSDDGQSIHDAYLLEAELLLKQDRADEALAAYGRGLAIFEDDPQFLYARALAQAELGRVAEAERDLRHLIAMDPENADALNALGYTLADNNQRLAEAREYIERALELAPDSAAIIDSLGWVLFRMGERENAIEHLRRAFELQPDPEIAAHLGEALWAGGDAAGARASWQQGLELDPDSAVLRQTMERLDP